MIERVKAACGNVHFWVIAGNVAVSAILVGIAWGSLSENVGALRREMDQHIIHQDAWNDEEHRQDDIHRVRINQIESEFFELLRDLRKDKP